MNKTQKVGQVILSETGDFDPLVTMARLREIFDAAGFDPSFRSGSFQRVASDLSKIANVSPEWTAKYVHSVFMGYKGCSPSPAFGRAVDIYAEMIDAARPDQAGFGRVSVLARLDRIPDGAVIPAAAAVAECIRPSCRVQFVKISNLQKYCSPRCREEWAEEKRRLSGK